MTWQGWFTLLLLVAMLAALVRYSALADVIFLGGLALLGLSGTITPAEALIGFSNSGLLTVAALFVVAAALRETGAIEIFARKILRQADGLRRVLARLCIPVAAVSPFINNTAKVAIIMPVVVDWCRKHRIAASRLLIPLDYAAIAGGMCSLIGTSTNLVVHGLMITAGMHGLGFFEIAGVGLPLTIATLAYLIILGPKLLPDRQEFLERLEASRREFLVEMRVQADCPLIGQSISDAGLRQLPGLFLVEIARGEEIISPVAPDEIIRGGDQLCFAGVVGTIVDLQKIRGLAPVVSDSRAAAAARDYKRHLCEAVISQSSPLVGRGIREANFRTVYDAAVIAVHRSGARLTGKIGDIELKAGDTLLLQTSVGFVRAHRNNPDFYLVSEVAEAEPVRHEKAALSLFILLGLVIAMATPEFLQWLGVGGRWAKLMEQGQAVFAISAAVLMVMTRCISAASARRCMPWDTLLVIAASFGIATAMEKSGMAASCVDYCRPLIASAGRIGALAIVYVVTNLLTELLTNNAAAALIFPIAVSTAAHLGLDARPFAIVVAVAASGGFVVPIGYQTHMMIFGPGGYRFSDFVRAGLPLNILWLIVTLLVVPLVWPLAH